MGWKDALGELAVFLKSSAPEVWSIMRAQVALDIWSRTIWSWVVGGLVIFFVVLAMICDRRFRIINRDRAWASEGDGWVVGEVSATFFAVMCLVICIALVLGIHPRTVNPDYYAIEKIIQMMK